MVTTNDEILWRKMWEYKDHGKSYDAVYKKVHPKGYRWLHESFGTNWRMIYMQAVIGRIQLKKMSQWHEERLRNATQIWEFSKNINGLRVGLMPETIEHAAYKCYVNVDLYKLKEDWSRDRVIEEINARGVPCFSGACSEIYKERAFDGQSFKPINDLPNAYSLGQTSLMFTVHPGLSSAAIQKTCDTLRDVMSLAVKPSED
jgi:dTDP-4-amino-4,6-dideoxygalactose transaminase